MATFYQGSRLGKVFFGGVEAAFVFGRGTQIFPHLPVELSGSCEARIVTDAAARWFEFGFTIDTSLTGNSGAGWTDPGLYVRLEIEWSPDLVNWSMGKFLPAPIPVVAAGDGTLQYWSRAINPQDANVKTGALVLAQTGGDVRLQPFTSLVIAGVSQALPNFPYAMPAGAAQLQADLRALGWANASVTAASSATWNIAIPVVNHIGAAQESWVGFTGFEEIDPIGGPFIIDRFNAGGQFVDAQGTPIFPRAFARLKISNGTRYL